MINGTCSTCPVGTEYNILYQCCLWKSPCAGANEIFANGVCVCAFGHQRDLNKACKRVDPVCPADSYYNLNTGCCVCNSGFVFQAGGICTSIVKTCPANSALKNDVCVCNDGFNSIMNECKRCETNEIFSGVECVCAAGFVRNAQGSCIRQNLITCA